MEEKWKAIAGYEGIYEVSNFGRVRSIDRLITHKAGVAEFYKGKILKQYKNGRGYCRVTLARNGEKKPTLVHRIVAQAFLPNPSNLPQVNHIDEIKTNNNVENLEWCTNEDNFYYSSDFQKPIVATYDNGERVVYASVSDAAKDINCSATIIYMALARKVEKAIGIKWDYLPE